MISSFAVMEWLHGFRMPLFFLISGFFCHMILGKYAMGRYLAKRWWRIGCPMLIPLIALGCLHMSGPDPLGGVRGQTYKHQPAVPLSPELKRFNKCGDGKLGDPTDGPT
jgi:hypothetical protein